MAETKTPAQIKAEHDAAEKKRHEDAKKAQAHSEGSSHFGGRGGGTVGGAMTTYDPNTPKFDQFTGEPIDPKERSFTHDEIGGLAGDIGRGELGHIHLDEKGTPHGSAFKEIPGPDEIFADVYGNPAVVFDDIVTPTGAPITKRMNPSIPLWDAGMLARNPPPEGGRPGDMPKGPVGGGVRNTPVTT
jgi:hypothetical protein